MYYRYVVTYLSRQIRYFSYLNNKFDRKCSELPAVSSTRSFFPQEKRRPPAGAADQLCGRPGRPCRPGARSAQKKRAEVSGASLLAAVNSTLFFASPAETSQPKTGFRGSSGNGIHRCPLADKGGCSSNEAQSAEGFSLLRDNAELREIFRRKLLQLREAFAFKSRPSNVLPLSAPPTTAPTAPPPPAPPPSHGSRRECVAAAPPPRSTGTPAK